ncbi:uncharacterized protein METZ01_LOCUS297267 [marine metagenome]|uniref:Helix-turn-helix domain-containing protein n=1 Tax=marine metagenome TaxID=408172 RepID=A0A382M651_9ZZZZ
MNLRVKDVAVQLNISEKTVYKWLRDGLLPARRIGKTWIITEEALRSVSTPTSLRPGNDAISPAPHRLITAGFNKSSQDPLQVEPPHSEGETLNKFVDILAGATQQGLSKILGPRSSDQNTIQTIASSLEAAEGEILLQGIGLREFFGEKSYTAILRQMSSNNRAVQVRAILVNPVSEFARARAVAEDGLQFEDEGQFKSGPLYNDSWRSLNVIADLKKQSELRTRFGIDVRFVDHWPSVYMVMTAQSAFIETYHFGKPNSALDGTSIDGLVPMFHFESSSAYAQILRQHFNYIWSGSNPHIKTFSLGEIAEAMQVVF